MQVLTKGGFPSKARPRRGNAWISDSSAVTLKRQQKLDRLQKTTHDLVVAWGLSLLCGIGHLGHVWPGAPAWVHALHHPVLAATMSAAALLGEQLAGFLVPYLLPAPCSLASLARSPETYCSSPVLLS